MAKLEMVDEGWERFVVAVKLENMHPHQRQEMRRAFFAGAMFLFAQFEKIGGDEITEQDGVEHMERIDLELKMFVQMVGRVPGF